jgi:flagellar biosynthesis/type III secretory pathway chaperone
MMIELNSTFLINFEGILRKLQTRLALFQQFLDDEKLLLNKQDLEGLEASTLQKQTFINDVQLSMNELKESLNSQTFEEKNIHAVLDLYAPEKRQEMLSLWNDVKMALEQCDQKNLLNGILITTMKNINDVLVRIMTQRAPESTYSNQQNTPTGTVSTREHKA